MNRSVVLDAVWLPSVLVAIGKFYRPVADQLRGGLINSVGYTSYHSSREEDCPRWLSQMCVRLVIKGSQVQSVPSPALLFH